MKDNGGDIQQANGSIVRSVGQQALSLDSPTHLHDDGDAHVSSSFKVYHQSRVPNQPGHGEQTTFPERQRSRSPARKMVTAYLSNLGHSRLTAMPGVTVREALSKAMNSRRLVPETCAVYNLSDPNKVVCRVDGDKVTFFFHIFLQSSLHQKISWDMDSSVLEEEIKVVMSDRYPVTTSISHNFDRKTFFSLAFCECCRKLLFTVRRTDSLDYCTFWNSIKLSVSTILQGFYCRTCGYKFHQRCEQNVPKLCKQVRMEKVLAQT